MMGSLSPMMVCSSVMSPDTKNMQPMTRARSPSVPPCAAAGTRLSGERSASQSRDVSRSPLFACGESGAWRLHSIYSNSSVNDGEAERWLLGFRCQAAQHVDCGHKPARRKARRAQGLKAGVWVDKDAHHGWDEEEGDEHRASQHGEVVLRSALS